MRKYKILGSSSWSLGDSCRFLMRLGIFSAVSGALGTWGLFPFATVTLGSYHHPSERPIVHCHDEQQSFTLHERVTLKVGGYAFGAREDTGIAHSKILAAGILVVAPVLMGLVLLLVAVDPAPAPVTKEMIARGAYFDDPPVLPSPRAVEHLGATLVWTGIGLVACLWHLLTWDGADPAPAEFSGRPHIGWLLVFVGSGLGLICAGFHLMVHHWGIYERSRAKRRAAEQEEKQASEKANARWGWVLGALKKGEGGKMIAPAEELVQEEVAPGEELGGGDEDVAVVSSAGTGPGVSYQDPRPAVDPEPDPEEDALRPVDVPALDKLLRPDNCFPPYELDAAHTTLVKQSTASSLNIEAQPFHTPAGIHYQTDSGLLKRFVFRKSGAQQHLAEEVSVPRGEKLRRRVDHHILQWEPHLERARGELFSSTLLATEKMKDGLLWGKREGKRVAASGLAQAEKTWAGLADDPAGAAETVDLTIVRVERLKILLDCGAIDQAEFEVLKTSMINLLEGAAAAVRRENARREREERKMRVRRSRSVVVERGGGSARAGGLEISIERSRSFRGSSTRECSCDDHVVR